MMCALVNAGPHRAAGSKERVISTGLSPAAFGFLDLADELAAVDASHLATARRAGLQFSEALAAVVGALGRLSEQTTPAALIELSARELCATGLFDRVMLSKVRGSTWLPQAMYRVDSRGRVTLEIDGVVEQLAVPLASPLVEAEVVRRRLPALIQDAQRESRTYRPLVERTGTREYVVAPVVADSVVIALLHADVIGGTRPLTALDRDLVRVFADGVGVNYERVGLADSVQRQRSEVAAACDAAMRSLREIDGEPVTLARLEAGPITAAREALLQHGIHAGRSHQSGKLARLTTREREVLALLASGATNAQLADRLTVAESTVKSHVKHILHKLGAGNRAAAIACYLKESHVDERRSR